MPSSRLRLKSRSWDASAFCNELQSAFGWRLGRIKHAGERAQLSSGINHGHTAVSHRLALVGNAAQTLHPIAGQGFNLGLRDVMSLAKTLACGNEASQDVGSYGVLAEYQQRRHADKIATIGVTDGLVQLFANRWAPLVVGRNLGLMAMEHLLRHVMRLHPPDLRLGCTVKPFKESNLQCFDVAIVGGGMVGLARCLWFTRQRLACCGAGNQQPSPFSRWHRNSTRFTRFGDQCRQRKTADIILASGENHFPACQCYHGMEVWDQDSFGHIAFVA